MVRILYDLIVRIYWVSKSPRSGCCAIMGAVMHSLNVLLLFPVATILNAAAPLKPTQTPQDSDSGGQGGHHRYDEMMPLRTYAPTTHQPRPGQLRTRAVSFEDDDPAPVYSARAPTPAPQAEMSPPASQAGMSFAMAEALGSETY